MTQSREATTSFLRVCARAREKLGGADSMRFTVSFVGADPRRRRRVRPGMANRARETRRFGAIHGFPRGGRSATRTTTGSGKSRAMEPRSVPKKAPERKLRRESSGFSSKASVAPSSAGRSFTIAIPLERPPRGGRLLYYATPTSLRSIEFS